MDKQAWEISRRNRMRDFLANDLNLLQKAAKNKNQSDLAGSKDYLDRVFILMFVVGTSLLNGDDLTGPEGLITDFQTLEQVKSVAHLGLKSEIKELRRYKKKSQQLLNLFSPDEFCYLNYLSFCYLDDEMFLNDFVRDRFFERDQVEKILIAMEAVLGKTREQILGDESIITPAFRIWLADYDKALKQKTVEAGRYWFFWPQEKIPEKYQERFFWQNVPMGKLDWYSTLLENVIFTRYEFQSGGNWLGRLVQRIACHCEFDSKDFNSDRFLDRFKMKYDPIRIVWCRWTKYIVSPIVSYYYPSKLWEQLR
jgi:hypothetical protein